MATLNGVPYAGPLQFSLDLAQRRTFCIARASRAFTRPCQARVFAPFELGMVVAKSA